MAYLAPPLAAPTGHLTPLVARWNLPALSGHAEDETSLDGQRFDQTYPNK